MAAKKTCPSCKNEIDASASVCPECHMPLEILKWEIEQESGEKRVYTNVQRISSDLVYRKLKLSNNCRQYTDVLVQVVNGQKEYSTKGVTAWKTIKYFAEDDVSLLSLYDPKRAYGKRVAETTIYLVGGIVAVGWVSIGLIAVGANPLIAIVLSIVLLVAFPTVIGAFLVVGLTASAYDIPALGLALRILIAYILGVGIGYAVGFTIGRWVGMYIGSRKPKEIEG